MNAQSILTMASCPSDGGDRTDIRCTCENLSSGLQSLKKSSDNVGGGTSAFFLS
jgi:hypothetical protein